MNNSDDKGLYPNLVQITARKEEVDRRIKAFITKKRKDIDEWNVQEFCGRVPLDESDPAWELQESCARVDAIFVPHSGNRSRVKVSSVVNQWGPQTRRMISNRSQETLKVQENAPHGIEERLRNMEAHLKLKLNSQSMYARLKQLEDRILYLEGISPDYFQPGMLRTNPTSANAEFAQKYQDWSVQNIDRRIQELKESLKNS